MGKLKLSARFALALTMALMLFAAIALVGYVISRERQNVARRRAR